MPKPPNSPTPDYGTLGPGSDIKNGVEVLTPWGTGQPVFGSLQPVNRAPQAMNAAPRAALVFVAMLASIGMAAGVWMYTRVRVAADGVNSARTARQGVRQADAAAQREAEQLLQRAVGNDAAATAQIEARSAAWRGRIQLTPQLKNLVGAGMDARDLRTRAASIRLELAALNVAEDDASVDQLATQAESNDHATRIWALWTLGLLANRGVETERVTGILTAHLSDKDAESRHWAVEGLAYGGGDDTVPLLLKALHDDPSPMVRERAACGLAESGMFTPEQRRTAIPTLLTYADDPSLDAATHAWIFHALRDITGQTLPDNASQWKEWYERNR